MKRTGMQEISIRAVTTVFDLAFYGRLVFGN